MRIDYAVLADYAEVVKNKLYLMGGGWESANAAKVPHQLRLGIAVGVRIEWEETNRPITVVMHVEHEDGASLARIDGRLQVGRPAHLLPGASQLTQMAVNLALQMPSYAVYRVRIIASGEGLEDDTRILPFRLMEQKAAATR